jgi:hypothetical protein
MPSGACGHIEAIEEVKQPGKRVCDECVKTGAQWVHLRTCQECGSTHCCDSSPNRHATAHFHADGHPLVQSYEPGENWWWCYRDNVAFEVAEAPSYSHT